MDINTEVAKQKNQIPSRFLNQIDNSKNAQEKYAEAREEMIDNLKGQDSEEGTELSITSTIERK